MPSVVSSTRVLPRGAIPSQGFWIGKKTFEDIENFIADNESSAVRVQQGIDLLARAMVLVIKGEAQKRSGGQVAARQRSNPALANRIPVQRITGRYFAGWMIRRLGNGHYLMYNDSVEAYLIETGMYQRVRRPILKMSMLQMLALLQTTRTGERFLDWVIAPRRNARGQFQSFSGRVSGTTSLGGLAGPTGKLPG